MKTAATISRSANPETKGRGGRTQKPFFKTSTPDKSNAPAIQTKLRLGQPGDRFEQEADQVADRVADNRAAPNGLGHALNVTPLTQRMEEKQDTAQAQEEEEAQTQAEKEEAQAQEEEEAQTRQDEDPQTKNQEQDDPQLMEEEEAAQTKEDEEEAAQTKGQQEEEAAQTKEEEEETLQPKSAGSRRRPSQLSDDISRRIRSAQGRGNPMPDALRQKLETRFGTDFSGVRIHTDHVAVTLSKALRAQAFARGPDIFFNEGRFAPGSRQGMHLLAHELTHTIQQGAVTPKGANIINLSPGQENSYEVRPELLRAIALARGEIGKVNAKLHGGDGKRIGWQRITEFFDTALGPGVIHPSVLEKVTMIDSPKGKKDALPSWCGIFTWWAMKKAGLPIPNWKLGAVPLDALEPRKPGELPRKGDIAIDVLPNNHFAMVTGLESTADATGKPNKLIRVSTINGNTAGEDNLGGQVQEKWHSLSHWDHFLNPVGRMTLPEVPLVATSRTPDPIDQSPASAVDPVGKAVIEEPSDPDRDAKLATLEQSEPQETTPDTPDAYPEPDLSLPPPADPGPAEKVAEIEKVDFGSSSDGAASAYLGSKPSSMAASQKEFAPAVDGAMKSEQKNLVENPPELQAKTSGAADAPLIGPNDIPIPGDAGIGDGIKGQDAGALDPAADPSPSPFTGNKERSKELDKEDSGSFWDRFKGFLLQFTNGIKTADGGVSTSAGATPGVDLDGKADATRMQGQRTEGTDTLKKQRDAQTGEFRSHPGQGNIQPRQVDETRTAAPAADPKAEVTLGPDAAMAQYAGAPFSKEVRDAGDGKIGKKTTPNLAEARGQITTAATTRDTDKKNKIDTAQAAATKLNQETDSAQRNLVTDNRGKVAKLQGEGIGDAYQHVNDFSKDAAKEEGTARKSIGTHVKSEESKAKDKLKQGEKDAEKRKKDDEEKAASKKRELKKEQNKGSWWDRVKNAIKKAVKVITDAIDTIFTAMRNAVKTIIETAKNAAIGLINKARNWVVDKIDKFRDWAKDKVNKYLKDSFPGLARRINNGIDAVADTAIKGVNAVADGAIKAVTALADGLAAALDKMLATFQTAMKTAVRIAGAVLQGDFAEALKAAIEGACEIAGINPKPVFDFFDRAGKAVMSILKHPVRFITNLFKAVGSGIGNFLTNIKKHLISGVIGWLTGALSEVNLSGPFEFSPKGILKIVLEVLGLTYTNIKARVIKRFPKAEKIFTAVEKGFELVKKLITEGPMALWDMIKKSLANLKETVMGAIRNWLIITAIREGVFWLLSLTNPASALVKAVKLIFDLVMFLVERFQQIKDFILSVYDAVAAMAAGNFSKVTKSVEDALARSVPVLISLFASVLGLGGIAKQVKKIIQTVTKPINKVIDKVVDKIVAFAKKILKKAKAGANKAKKKAKQAVAKLISWWKMKRGFKDKTGQGHTLSYKGKKKAADLFVASSNPTKIGPFLTDRMAKAKAGGTSYSVAEVTAAKNYHQHTVLPAEKKLEAADVGGKADKAKNAVDANNTIAKELQGYLDHMGKTWLSKFFNESDDKDFPPAKLPVMADNKKAGGFSADYIVKGEPSVNGYKHNIKTGTESGQHVGNLDGWPDLQGAKLTTGGQKYVRMHLLPHKLGGDAVDSNLTPARGDLFNTPFSSAVEQPAIQASTQGSAAKRQPVWYKFDISYYPSTTPKPKFWSTGKPYPVTAFPKRIHAEWGYYKPRKSGDKKIERAAAKANKTSSPKPPDLAVDPPAINADGPTALYTALNGYSNIITQYFVSELLIKNRPYANKTKMKDTLWIKLSDAKNTPRRPQVTATYKALGTTPPAVTMN